VSDQTSTFAEPRTLRDSPALQSDDGAASAKPMNLRFIDWIWNIRGYVPLAPGQSSDEAYSRLDALFDQPGTSYDRVGDALSFTKKDQAAQDKMSIFDAGVLQVEQAEGGPVMRYRMASRALLFCFLAPLLFLALGQLIVGVGMLEASSSAADAKAKKDEKKDDKDIVLKLHPIDEFLGSPAPEKPKKDKTDKKEDKKKDSKHSPTAAYVFASIFAALYVVGRILEDRLIKNLFRRKLHAE
jgi:hypothetical protein